MVFFHICLQSSFCLSSFFEKKILWEERICFRKYPFFLKKNEIKKSYYELLFQMYEVTGKWRNDEAVCFGNNKKWKQKRFITNKIVFFLEKPNKNKNYYHWLLYSKFLLTFIIFLKLQIIHNFPQVKSSCRVIFLLSLLLFIIPKPTSITKSNQSKNCFFWKKKKKKRKKKEGKKKNTKIH